jgi:hypothetical protein
MMKIQQKQTNELTTPPTWIKFKADDSEVTLDPNSQPTQWHKKNGLYSFTWMKSFTQIGKSFAMGLPQINSLIKGNRVLWK